MEASANTEFELDSYRESAEKFIEEIGREAYQHFAGHKESYEIEPIYEQFAELFEQSAVVKLREVAAEAEGEDARRLGMLLDFAVEGHLGQATKSQAAELALREASLEIELSDGKMGYRESAVAQANEPDRDRREEIEQARLAATAEHLTPLAREALDAVHDLSRELGFDNYRSMSEELSGIDLLALGAQTQEFLRATQESYPAVLSPLIEASAGLPLAEARRSDLPWTFRAKQLDDRFPQKNLIESFRETLRGLGIDPDGQPNVILDTEERPQKSPRAFCSPVRVPQEVYLVLPPVGGRDDYVTLMHEGGHAEHFGNVDPNLAFEYRYLGDNSVTEGFAFLFDHLVSNPAWLQARLGIEVDEDLERQRLGELTYYTRRYSSKLAYELALHGDRREDADLRRLYSERLSAATGLPWPEETYLTDVDPGYYAARYLRAWAFERLLASELVSRFGEQWFEQPEAGDLLKRLWSEGQRLRADELAQEVLGRELNFATMIDEINAAIPAS